MLGDYQHNIHELKDNIANKRLPGEEGYTWENRRRHQMKYFSIPELKEKLNVAEGKLEQYKKLYLENHQNYYKWLWDDNADIGVDNKYVSTPYHGIWEKEEREALRDVHARI